MSSTDDGAPLDQLFQLRSTDELDLQSRMEEMLAVGRGYLGVTNAHIKWTDEAAGTHRVLASVGEVEDYTEVGDEHVHATTYCRRTVERTLPLALSHASEQGWEDDPAYRRHGLECYLGSTIFVNGKTYGTVCFVDTGAREAFDPEERAFVELAAEFVGSEVEEQLRDRTLGRHEQLVTVLNRVLRHNLRNDLNVVHGSAEQLVARLEGKERDLAELARDSADDLLSLGEQARALDDLVAGSDEPTPREVTSIVEAVAEDLRDDAHDADISVTAPDSQRALATEHVRTALSELGENALAHAGPAPTVAYEVAEERGEQRFTVVSVSDDGDGLPPHEQRVLEGAEETPLDHGSGLGLWVVYWAITQVGGHLEVETDGGTTVRAFLPAPADEGLDLEWYLYPPFETGTEP